MAITASLTIDPRSWRSHFLRAISRNDDPHRADRSLSSSLLVFLGIPSVSNCTIDFVTIHGMPIFCIFSIDCCSSKLYVILETHAGYLERLLRGAVFADLISSEEDVEKPLCSLIYLVFVFISSCIKKNNFILINEESTKVVELCCKNNFLN